jgi:hypothetical protein
MLHSPVPTAGYGALPNMINLQGKGLPGFTGLAKGSPFFAKERFGEGEADCGCGEAQP